MEGAAAADEAAPPKPKAKAKTAVVGRIVTGKDKFYALQEQLMSFAEGIDHGHL